MDTLMNYVGNLQTNEATEKRPYKHLVHVRIEAGGKPGVACTALVDSGNVWRNVISKRMIETMGYNSQDLIPVKGQQTVGTAKEGSTLRILGQLKHPIYIKIGDHETRFKDNPVVLEGLAMDFNISGPFLKKHNVNQLHDKDCLGIQGQEVPLISSMGHQIAPPETIQDDLYLEEDIVVPAQSMMLASAYVTTPSQETTSVMIRGSQAFMRQTDLHPWMNAIVQLRPDGKTQIGLMNTTDEPIAVEKDTRYGTVRKIADTNDKEKYPWRVSLIDPQSTQVINAKPMTERETTAELPAWMKGPTNAQNQVKRLNFLIDKFKLKEKNCLKDQNDVTTAGLLLLKYWDTFSFDGSFGRTELLKHAIRLRPGQMPINQRYRPVNPALEGDLKKQLDQWLEHQVIEKSNSPWNFGLVAAPKKNGKVRWCIDFRELNKATIPSTTPIGNIEDNLAKLSRSTIFSGLDGTGAFHVIDLEDEDKEKTSFATPWGSFQFTQLPFGLSGGPSTYARLVNMVLDGLPHDQVLPYLDDTVIHTSNLPDHLRAMDRVLDAMRRAGLKLQPDKCQMFEQQIDYLGHRVTPEGLQTIPDYVEIVKKWPMPTTRTAIRAFLGKAGYYRRFIKDYAALAGPLYDATTYPEVEEDGRSKKSMDKDTLNITPTMIKAFQRLKQALTTAPILAYPDFKSTEPFILDTDWSLENNAVGGVLSQKQNGEERVICYGAKKLSPSQANYPSTKGELCAIIIFLQKWSYFLRHRPFHLRTDNAALKWIHTMEAPKGMVQRWLDTLANHQFTVEHRPGPKHANADALSRAPHLVDQNDTDISQGESMSTIGNLQAYISAIVGQEEDEEAWSREFLVQKQEEDEELQLIAERRKQGEALTSEEKQGLSRHARIWAGLMENLYTDHTGLTRYRYTREGETRNLILLTPPLWKEATLRAHEDVAHMGVSATTQRLMKHFYFPSMNATADEVVKGCVPCQRRGDKPKDQKHTLHSHKEGFPFQKLSLDFVGPLPRSTHGNEYLFTIRDTFTRWVEAFPIKRATAETAARILVEQVFPRFGFAEQLHSDRGTQFTGLLVTEIARTLGIRATTTPAYNPKSNPVERVHRDLGRAIRAMVQQRPNQWEEVLPHVLFVLRTTPCRSTGFAPYKLLFGRDATVPLDLIFGPPPHTDTEHQSDLEYVNTLRHRIESAHAWARRNMSETIRRQRVAYFKDKPAAFLPGQQVWLFTPTNVRGQRTKFNTYWTGPWTIKRRVNDLCYELLPDTRWAFFTKPVVVSIDRLKKWYPEECQPEFTQPPTNGTQIEMPGNDFAEIIHHNELEEGARNDPAPVPAPPPIPAGGQPPPNGGGGGNDRPHPPPPPGWDNPQPGEGWNPEPPPNHHGHGGARPRHPRRDVQADRMEEDHAYQEDQEEGVRYQTPRRRPPRQPHGPRLDAARAQLAAGRHGLQQQRQQQEDQRRERRERRNRQEQAFERENVDFDRIAQEAAGVRRRFRIAHEELLRQEEPQPQPDTPGNQDLAWDYGAEPVLYPDDDEFE